MTRAHFMTALLGFAFAWCAMPTARSDQLRIALVISNDEYGSQPGPKRCSASVTAVRDVLRGKGFKIIDRDNLDRAEFDSAIGALARRVAASPASLAVLYYCGYALEFDGQSFLLPTSATIVGDNDVLTQGIVAKNVVDSLGAAPQSRGFVLLDVFRTPNAAADRTRSAHRAGDLLELRRHRHQQRWARRGADSGIVGFARSIYRVRDGPRCVRCSDELPAFQGFSRDGPFCSCRRTEARTSRIAAACARDGRSFNRRARPAGGSACRVSRRPTNGRPCYDRHFNQCCGSVAGHSRCFNRRSRSACVGAATTSGQRFVAGATSGADRGAAADTRERGQAADPDDTCADGILCGADRRKVRTGDPGCRPSLSIRDQCRRDWSPNHRTGNQTPLRRMPAAPGTTRRRRLLRRAFRTLPPLSRQRRRRPFRRSGGVGGDGRMRQGQYGSRHPGPRKEDAGRTLHHTSRS